MQNWNMHNLTYNEFNNATNINSKLSPHDSSGTLSCLVKTVLNDSFEDT